MADSFLSSTSSSVSSNKQAVLVIPIFDEKLELLLPKLGIPFVQNDVAIAVSMIWVFNCPDDAEESAKSRTRAAMNELLEQFSFVTHSEQIYVTQVSPVLTLFVMDCCGAGNELPSKEGVGLARKLGMDLGLKILAQCVQEKNSSFSWIHCSDADVNLPQNYFDIPPPVEGVSACVYPFKHHPIAGYEKEVALYELSLRYFVDRLKWAGSPYAFHTIGSLIAVNSLSYAQVRGMPKRSGAEDFYFLNKLAKVGKINALDGPLIEIEGRPSHRVPFGTGPALLKLNAMNDAIAEYRYYHPEIFVALKAVLNTTNRTEPFASIEQFYLHISSYIDANMAEHTRTVLNNLNFEKAFLHINQFSDNKQRVNAFHTWFDGFITLRFIHLMRDIGYPSIALQSLKENSLLDSKSLQTYFEGLK